MSIDWRPIRSTIKNPSKEQGNRGVFPSSKVNGGIFEYESTLERNISLNSNHTKTFYKGIYTMWRRYINSEFL